MVVTPLPLLSQHLRLQQAGKLLRVQQLVSYLAVERLRVPVLPRRSGLDVQRCHPSPLHPGSDRPRDELRAVVRADMLRRAPLLHYRGQHRAYCLRRHAASHLQGQALPRVFVHQREPLQGPAVAGPVEEEIPRPDMVLVLRRPPHAAVGTRPQPPLLPLFPGDFQPLLPPEPVDPLAVDPPARAPQQGPDPTVAVARVLPHQLQHLRHQPGLPLPGLPGPLPLRGALLVQHTAGAALGDAEAFLEEAHRLPLLLGGHHFFSATSWSICLSSASSATRRFSRAFSASNSLSLLASSCLRPPYWLRQRCRVCSLTPRRWQTWARLSPWARSASACRNLAMTSSGVCRFMDRLLAPQGLRDSHTTWTTFWGAGQEDLTPLQGLPLTSLELTDRRAE